MKDWTTTAALREYTRYLQRGGTLSFNKFIFTYNLNYFDREDPKTD